MRELFAFVTELFRHSPQRRIVFIESDSLAERSYSVQAGLVRTAALCTGGTLVLVTALILAFSPVRNLIPGFSTAELRRDAILASMRLAALEDSVTVQLQYMADLKRILTNQVDSALMVESPSGEPVGSTNGRLDVDVGPHSEDWEDHEQPAVFVDRLTLRPASANTGPAHTPPSLLLPAITPVGGYTTQSFDAHTGHYGIDIATEEGKIVRSIGEGHVVFADWTHSGGHTIMVQHADGFITVFKHNRRLLKRVADRVQPREGVAITGNTGQHSTGPHLHFELWNSGLAQDPQPFLLGL